MGNNYMFDKRLSQSILIFCILLFLVLLVFMSDFGIISEEETIEIETSIVSLNQEIDEDDYSHYYLRLKGYSNLFNVGPLYGKHLEFENLKSCLPKTKFKFILSEKQSKHLNKGKRIYIYGIADSSRVYLDIESSIQVSKKQRRITPLLIFLIFIPLSIIVYYARRITWDTKK